MVCSCFNASTWALRREREKTMRTMTYLKDFVALSVFFTAGYVWLVIA
jgi:hypothetical protein